MQIKKLYQESFTKKVVDFLFADNIELKLTDSVIGRLTKRLYIPWVTESALIISIITLWYKGILVQYIPAIDSAWIVPALLISALILSDKNKITFRKFHLWYLGFLLVSLFSMILAQFSGLNGFLLLSGWYLFAQLLLSITATQGIGHKKTVMYSTIGFSIPVFIYGIYQVLIGVNTSNWFSTFESGGTRAFGFFGNPNVFGILAAMLAVFAFAQFLDRKKWYLLALSGLFTLSMGISLSRTAWLGFLIGLFVILTLKYRKFFWQVLIVPLVALFIPKIRERVFIVFSDNYIYDSVLDGRLWSIINGNYLFLKKPLFGWGPGSYGGRLALENASPVYLSGIQNGYTALYFTDNQYIELLVQVGLFGFLTFLFSMISEIVSLVKSHQKKNSFVVLGAIGAFCVFLTSGLFANVLEFGAIAVPMGILLGISANE
jgi:putative inorganic carbon (HCO3(-)) transporter